MPSDSHAPVIFAISAHQQYRCLPTGGRKRILFSGHTPGGYEEDFFKFSRNPPVRHLFGWSWTFLKVTCRSWVTEKRIAAMLFVSTPFGIQ